MGNRNQIVAPEVAQLAFHSALFIAARRIAELRLESPMRAERDEPIRFLALPSAQNLLHRALQVVVPQQPNTPPK